MFTPRLAALVIVLAGARLAVADNGPEVLTVFPAGAKSGETVEVTFSGSGFEGDEQLLFSAKGITSKSLGATTVAVDPNAGGRGKGGRKGMKGAAAVKFKVTVPKDAPLGLHDVRVVSKNGLSNPRAFAVGDRAEVNETEPNNDIDQAQRIELNTTINGVISTPTDVDFYVVKARAGQNVVVACLASTIDSRLSADLLVSSSDRKVLATNHGYRDGDAVLDFKAPADGDYVIRVASFAYATGGPDNFYRLTVTTGPWVDAVFPPLAGQVHRLYGRNLPGAEPDKHFTRPDGRPFDSVVEFRNGLFQVRDRLQSTLPLPPSAGGLDGRDDVQHPNLLLGNFQLEPQSATPCLLDSDDNATVEKAMALALPCDVAGRIARKNDRHWYRFDAKKGDVWMVEVFADRIGSPIAPYFVVSDEKGKMLARMDDNQDPQATNQFYTKSDDPGRYRLAAPADGTYRVMVSSIESGSQWGVRDQYVLRIAPVRPDFRLAVMPFTPHLTDAGTLSRNGASVFNVYVVRYDGFADPITLTATDLPPGVTCPPQTIAAGQTRGVLVLSADATAADWVGFVTIVGAAGSVRHEARPFSLVWSAQGIQPNQPPPNSPQLARLDRGPGLALAVRGDAPFALVPVVTELKAKPGDKLEVTLKVTRRDGFKDGIQVFSAVPNFGPKQQGNNPLPPIATVPADKNEMKVSIDVAQNLPAGTYSLVLRGQSGAPAPKTAAVRPAPGYPCVPITVTVEGRRR